MPRPKQRTPKYTLRERYGKFYVQWWEGGETRRISLRTSDKEEAKLAYKQFLSGIDSPPVIEEPSLKQILELYLENRSKVVSSVSTLKYSCKPLIEHLGHLKSHHITTKTSRDYAVLRRSQGKQGATGGKNKLISNGTIIRELVTLRAAFKWAIKEKWIREAPYIELPRTPPPRDRWLTRDEANLLLLNANTPHLKLFIELGLYTAARSGAILSLKWEQINFESNLILYGPDVGNKRKAILPIPNKLKESLLAAAKVRLTDYVIEFKGKPVKSVRHAFRELVKRSGLNDVTPHTLRHTAATWMVIGGVPFPMIAQYLGNSVEMIEKVYGHHSPNWLKQAATALAG